ncbi:hypothetical protein BC826DRAFT_1095299 [Russula brevipes]|nr:hypothetical protein BC826DRAFT_1095299 [Russula brevipes]
MASFSRLQLAAALIEYDNDPSDPTKPFRSAHESAVFAHLRRIPPLPPQRRKSVDYLSVEIPGENAAGSRLESPNETGSADGLRNPFGRDTMVSEVLLGEDEDGMEVDLASWGLDSFVPKEKGGGGKRNKGKEKVTALPNPHATTQASSFRSARSLSMGNIDAFGAGGAFLDSPSTVAPDMRRKSLGSTSYPPPRQRPSSTHDAIDRLPATPPLHSIPFPSRMGSRDLLTEAEEKPNPFALDPPPPGHASRFDPKAHARSMSVGTIGSLGSRNILAEDMPARSISPSSRLDPARTRTFSNASMLRDDDGTSFMSGAPARRQTVRDRPYSTAELMRPKILGQNVIESKTMGREGFEFSTDGPPLPHGARSNSSHRLSSGGLLGNASGSAAPTASNAFTPNPRASLTLSQLTFRNTLMVGGQRDVAYTDIESGVRRATEDGEQIIEEVPEEEPARPVTVVVEEPEPAGRPPGKLYGRSLVDELEHRKATMRSKQRVFAGDDRPSMMARAPMQRSSTLIDPTSLGQRPASQNLLTKSETRPNTGRRGSFGGKPLLNFDDDRSPGLQATPSGGRNGTRSVFGVDTLWEREMAKLKEIEAQEQEELRRQEAAEAEQLQKKSNKKKKGKEKAIRQDIPAEEPSAPVEESTIPAKAPALPAIPRGITRGPPPPRNDDETESSSELSDVDAPRSPPPRVSTDGWHSGESDKETTDGPVRTTGVGPRYPNRGGRRRPPAFQSADDEDSEEDMPLAATVSRAVERATRLELSDSDEEKPLSQLLTKSKYAEGGSVLDDDESRRLPVSAKPSLVEGKGRNRAEEQERTRKTKTRGQQTARFAGLAFHIRSRNLGTRTPEDDDDLPLGLHPEQQRRTQYNIQQLLLQAQMQQSMMFNPPSLMGSGFFGAPVMPQMMPLMPTPVPPSPPPDMQDTTKFGRVDRWRREIVGGQP